MVRALELIEDPRIRDQSWLRLRSGLNLDLSKALIDHDWGWEMRIIRGPVPVGLAKILSRGDPSRVLDGIGLGDLESFGLDRLLWIVQREIEFEY